MPSRRALLQLLAAAPLAAGALSAFAAPAAPEFTGLDGWINTATPLSLAALRGKVVLVDFWTYSCINCRRTVPYLNRWQAQYGAQGLQVIGIHTPEFGFEHDRPNVAESVQRLGIRFPVGQDNAFRTWRAWGNEAWPSFYLVDRNGRIVLVREGEGHAHELEAAIRALLGLAPGVAPVPGDDPDLSRIRTAEIYFGALHPTPQDQSQRPRAGLSDYAYPPSCPVAGEYQLDGNWLRQGDALTLGSPRGGVRVRFSAAKLHLVAGAAQLATLRISVDDAPAREVEVERPTLYTLFDADSGGEHVLTLTTETPGLSLYSATFG